MLSSRLIALQGIGGVALAVALQGFVAVDQVTPVTPTLMAGGGAHEQELDYMLQQQIREEDEIIIMAVAQLIVHGAFT